MKRKTKKWLLLSLSILLTLLLCLYLTGAKVSADDGEGEEEIIPEPVETGEETGEEIFECKVVIVESAHGTISVDKIEGHIGDIVKLNAKHELFYIVASVSANGVNLIEDENTSGLYAFALVEGENKIEAVFEVDKDLLGEMSVVYEQAKDRDWTNLFSVENVLRLISFLFNGGLLFAMIKYFIKDKKLTAIVEKRVKESVENIIPDTTKEVILNSMKDIIVPYFTEALAKLNIKQEDLGNAMTVFSRCFALSLENTPEARIAITQELSSMKLSDQEAVSSAKKAIEDLKLWQEEQNNALIKRLEEIDKANKKIIAEAEIKEEKEEIEEPVEEVKEEKEEVKEENLFYKLAHLKDDGTQI